MYHVIRITTKDKELCKYFDELTKNYNNMINVLHFNVRQLMTGLAKPETERQPNEIKVIEAVENAILLMNAPKKKKDGSLKIKKNNLKPKKTKNIESKTKTKPKKKKPEGFTMPTAEEWFRNYMFWDAFFKVTKNNDYYNLPGHVNQAAIKEALDKWDGYFSALRSFKNNFSEFTGMPNPPGYRPSGAKATTTLSNTICKIKKSEVKDEYILRFPKTKLTLNLGNTEFLQYKLKQVQIVPIANYYEVLLVMDDGKVENKPSEETGLFREVNRIIGIDLGIDNLAAISNNIGLTPIVIKGKTIKSHNQWFNKKNAELQSYIDTNTENIHNGFNAKEQQDLIFAYRERFFRDIFHKVSKYIINYCIENNIDTIVIGKNKQQKQDINLGRHNNQNFCSIPHQQLVNYITYKAYREKINVITTEESYTSKASFLDNDNIPVYKKGDDTKYTFSGHRRYRGLYVSSNGTLLNADINGASNIIRKAVPTAFNNITDFSYLSETVKTKNYHDFTKYQKSKINSLTRKGITPV